ncbi:hypothetical protein Tco_0802937, partial [Tanacetum coccineum]
QENIKDKSLGKQTKFNKYPSVARDEGSKCPWRCYGKMMTTEASFQVISLNDELTCVRNFKYGTLINYRWIGKHFGPKIRKNPEIKLHEIGDLVDKPPKSPRTKGRPKKNRDVESTSLVDEPDVAMNVTGGFATFEVGGSSATSSTTKRGGKRVKFNTNGSTIYKTRKVWEMVWVE